MLRRAENPKVIEFVEKYLQENVDRIREAGKFYSPWIRNDYSINDLHYRQNPVTGEDSVYCACRNREIRELDAIVKGRDPITAVDFKLGTTFMSDLFMIGI